MDNAVMQVFFFLHPSHITILNAIILNIMHNIFKLLEEVPFANNLL